MRDEVYLSCMLQVSALYIYPIKSLGGTRVNRVRVTDRGFEYDRRWMLVDENGVFISQREFPEMALIKTDIRENGLFVYKDAVNSLLIPFGACNTEKLHVNIWGIATTASVVSSEADKWFSAILQRNCRLVYMEEDDVVPVDGRYSIGQSLTSFSDGFPILMISEESLEDLNKRSTETVPMNRFRPNLVIKGGKAFEENELRCFTINDVVLYGVKPSARCVVTTINQLTAAKGKEPLKTLATYRSANNKIYFGENVIAANTGVINQGDSISITEKKESLLHTT